MQQAATALNHRIRAADVTLPPPNVSISQDREWCAVQVDGEWRKIRFHDYDEIYEIPGLYETLFYDILRCSSPATIRRMLAHCIHEARGIPEDLRVLDLGAGNGMVGEQLAGLGVQRIVGVDIIQAAAQAASRDRGGVYSEYIVLDMAEPSNRERERLRSFRFNCLTCVAALGFGDIPPVAFANACDLIEEGGWIAFNIKNDFLDSKDPSGFARLIRRMIDKNVLHVRARQRYRHRVATSGEPLYYTALVGVKNRDLPLELAT
jgi:predicted TPR repeat methyltransferase